jgi:hypothetical protein
MRQKICLACQTGTEIQSRYHQDYSQTCVIHLATCSHRLRLPTDLPLLHKQERPSFALTLTGCRRTAITSFIRILSHYCIVYGSAQLSSLTHRILKSCVGFEVFTAVVMKSINFWDVTPCSLLRCNRRFRETCRFHLQGRKKFQQEPASKQVAACWFLLKISSTLGMEAICSSETSVASQQTTRRHFPEDDTFYWKAAEIPTGLHTVFAYVPIASSHSSERTFTNALNFAALVTFISLIILFTIVSHYDYYY